ncbi:MAG: hypothetical protein ACYDBB_03145 [Armatimonadota bacterium]
MNVRLLIITLGLLAWSVCVRAGEVQTELFAETPAPAAGVLVAPQGLTVDGAANRCYVLDLNPPRVVAFTLEGRQTDAWALDEENVNWDAQLATDPVLPLRLLAVKGETVYLLNFDRPPRRVDILPVHGPGEARSLVLPEHATNGAMALDTTGHLVVAYLVVEDGKASLLLAREGADGTLDTLDTLPNPCEGQAWNLSLTGIALASDGRVAVGIAQSGTGAYTFVRSWLAQGTVKGASVSKELQTTHRFSLIDQRGKLLERFRPMAELAGTRGYAAKPCVPLFTSLAFGAGSTVISGGHTVDPFLRVYGKAGQLLYSLPRQAIGGQRLASFVEKGEARLFALSTAAGRVEELTADGRVVGGAGKPSPYDLSAPLSLAADEDGVYVAVRGSRGYQLLRFNRDGQFQWSQRITPPPTLDEVKPLLAVPGGDRVVIGWRQPDMIGIGWLDTVLEDGTPGLPLWDMPVNGRKPVDALPTSPSPLLVGMNGRLYVMRETKDGPRLYAFSATGTQLQQFPAEIQGITAVTVDGDLAWAHPDDQGMVIDLYSPQGAKRGWKRVPRPAENAALLPIRTSDLWGWLTSTETLLRMDDTFTVVDEATILAPNGENITEVSAVSGDRKSTAYFALPGRILKANLDQK